jgi:hypothetical protein
MPRIDYDGRAFRSAGADSDDDSPIGRYHQRGDLVWAEFAGGAVREGRLVGTCDADGVLEIAYCQVLADGQVVAGRSTSLPAVGADGRVRLEEHWRRLDGGTGVSWIEEIR